MIAGEENMNWETVSLILTEELGMRTICVCAQESLTTTAGCVVERSF
jgi:hypothetical protein